MANPSGFNKVLLFIGLGAGVLIFLMVAVNPFVIVGPTERGVKINLGQVIEEVLPPGVHFKTPFAEEIRTYSVVPVEIDYQILVGNDGAITKDNQTIGAQVILYYTYKADQIITLAKNYTRESLESIIGSSLKSAVKSVLGRYTIFDVAANQDKIRGEVFEEMKTYTASYPVIISQINLTNFDWADSFDRQIEETMIQAQKVQQTQQELQVAELESQKQVKQAQSARDAAIAQAEGEKQAAILRAEAKAAEGDGVRRYNASIAANSALELRRLELEIEKIRAEKWDGRQVPETQVVVPGFGTIQAK